MILLPAGLGLYKPASVSGSYWNPSDKGSFIALANSDKEARSTAAGTWHSVRSVTAHSTGKWYAECLYDTVASQSRLMFGVANSSASLTTFLGAGAGGWTIQNDTGGPSTLRLAGSTTASGLTAASSGQRTMVAYDAATGKIWLGVNGTWYNSGDPGAGTNATVTISAGTQLYLGLAIFAVGEITTLKNQVGENAHTIPSGYSMWG